ncbi:MAG TPA: hypothetical protein VGK32_21485 [Vicinamibacterales bacterium]
MPASIFTRGPERLCCEYGDDCAGFALVLRTDSGGSITQRFPDATSLARRRLALEQMLMAAGWVLEQVSQSGRPAPAHRVASRR